MNRDFFLILFFSHFLQFLSAQVTTYLPNAHAHNDYEKCRPSLTKALSLGFASVEVDVFPVNEKLKVAHIGLFVPTAQSLEKLYFMKIDAWLKKNGRLYQDSSKRIVLMIDIKKNAPKAYFLLRKLCQKYADWITTYYPRQDSLRLGQVDVLLSGHKPYRQVQEDSIRYMFIDGSISDLNNTKRTARLVPRISARYGAIFKWRGRGEMPQSEKTKLKELVRKAHQKGCKLRFWAMPNKKVVWQTLLEAGVDWMNVDKIQQFHDFYWNESKYRTKKRSN